MRKGICIVFLICFTLITASCGIGQNNTIDKKNSIPANGDQSSVVGKALEKKIEQKPVLRSTVESANNANYEIIEQIYTDRKVTIKYPQVAKMNDSTKQEMINELIKSEAFYKLAQYSDSDLDKLSMKINYEIKWQSAELLSIKYSGLRYSKGNAHHTNLFYTTNINMHDGIRLRLKDLVMIDNNFSEKIKQGKLIPVSPVITLEMLSRYTGDKLIGALNTADSLDYHENKRGAYSYFTNGYLGISIEVGHMYGDHVEFEVEYQDISDHIKAENEVWQSFFK